MLLAASTLTAGTGAAYGATPLAKTSQPTPVSAYGGVIAWSAFSADAYHLMVSVGGVVTAVPTSPEPQAFDASVGPDSSNGPTVLFSRCRRYRGDPSQLLFAVAGSECRVYAYSPTSHTVARLALKGFAGESLTHPSEWGSRVAVAMSTPGVAERIEVLSLSGQRYTRLAGSTLERAGVDSLHLAGSRVISGWFAKGGLESEVLLDTLAGGRELLAEGEQGTHSTLQVPDPTGVQFFGAGLAGSEAYWVAPGDGLIGTPAVISFYNVFTHTSTTEDASPNLFSVARDDGHLYFSTGTNGGGCPCEILEQ